MSDTTSGGTDPDPTDPDDPDAVHRGTATTTGDTPPTPDSGTGT